jgi:proteasome accessory factor A
MPVRPGDRIFGIETEFGTLVSPEVGRPEDVVEAIKDTVFNDQKLGALDLHARDEVFEPAESGGFLLNGGRLYIDAVGSHLEYATPECRRLKDVVSQDRAGHRIIVRAIRELGLQDEVDVYDNSVDHFGGHTFGCHENYLVRMSEDFFSSQVPLILGFLVTRQIFAGVGRVGGHFLAAGGRPDLSEVSQHPIDYIWVSQIYNVYPDDTVPFQLSQRADHIIKTVASRVRFNRALINPKWEHFYAHEGMHRLHLLFGEANQSEYAYALKVGTTCLVLRLLEDDLLGPEWVPAEPLIALREVSRDQSYRWPVRLLDGSVVGAVELQRRFRELAERYRGASEDTDWTLDEWASVLDGLDSDPLAMADRLDWVLKRQIVEEYRQSEGLEPGDDALHSVDLEYHNIDPEKSLFHACRVRRIVEDVEIVDAMTEPPGDTRAAGRGRMVRHVLARTARRPYAFDWSGASLDRLDYQDMSDPFETYLDVPLPG